MAKLLVCNIVTYNYKFTTALRNKNEIKFSIKISHLTVLPQCIACYLTAYYVEGTPFTELSMSKFLRT